MISSITGSLQRYLSVILTQNRKVFNKPPPIVTMKNITKKSFRLPCKICGRRLFYVSQNGLCIDCLTNKVQIARLQIKLKEGSAYEKWKAGMMRAAGVGA